MMEVDAAVRTRRTHKAYRPEPVDAGTLDELLDLARWAPNHHLTNPWRFRILGPASLERLKAAADAAKPGSGRKLDRAPTLVVVSARQTGDPMQDREDVLATGADHVLAAPRGQAKAAAKGDDKGERFRPVARILVVEPLPDRLDAVDLDPSLPGAGPAQIGRTEVPVVAMRCHRCLPLDLDDFLPEPVENRPRFRGNRVGTLVGMTFSAGKGVARPAAG